MHLSSKMHNKNDNYEVDFSRRISLINSYELKPFKDAFRNLSSAVMRQLCHVINQKHTQMTPFHILECIYVRVLCE